MSQGACARRLSCDSAVTAEFAPMSQSQGLARGTPAFRRAVGALSGAGFASFALLYCVQPLMPRFSVAFGVGPAAASLSLSLATAALALTMLAAGLSAEAWPRKPVMTVSLAVAALLALAAAAAPGWHGLLALRLLQGAAIGGVPALAMAYLAEEVAPSSLGFAMGLYIGGTALGGMSGRVLAGLLAHWADWRLALAGIGASGLAAALLVGLALPGSRHFRPRRGAGWRAHLGALGRHLGNPGLRALYAVAFLLMGSFVAVYNYTGYRLAAAPFALSQAAAGSIFVVYLLGVVASMGFGRLADRHGRGPALIAAVGLMLAGLGLTLPASLVSVTAGVAVLTVGFFGAHSTASGWVGRLADGAQAPAAALYLLCYYLGSSVVGSGAGLIWSRLGWPGLAAALTGLVVLALAAAAVPARGPA